MRKRLACLVVLFIVSGCGTEEQTATSASFAQEKAIIFEGRLYAGSDENVTIVGDPIGVIDQNIEHEAQEDQANGNYSNYYAEGSRIFEIGSRPVSEAIAVETEDHRYVEAIAFP